MQYVQHQLCWADQKQNQIDSMIIYLIIKHNANTTVATHFNSHNMTSNPEFNIHVLEDIKIPKSVPRSNMIRDTREISWIHRLNTLIPNSLNILGWGVKIQEDTKSLKTVPQI